MIDILDASNFIPKTTSLETIEIESDPEIVFKALFKQYIFWQ